LHLGGPNQTVPTLWLSDNDFSAASFLANGIPQKASKLAFADPLVPGDAKGHMITGARITYISLAVPPVAPHGRFMSDGSVPSATMGMATLTGDGEQFVNSRAGLFNFKWINLGGVNAVVEVLVW
jgi:hypothetical protein